MDQNRAKQAKSFKRLDTFLEEFKDAKPQLRRKYQVFIYSVELDISTYSSNIRYPTCLLSLPSTFSWRKGNLKVVAVLMI
jgi:hypothetical protein